VGLLARGGRGEVVSTKAPLEVVLFAADRKWVRRGLAAGIESFLVDWECRGKQHRQRSADTEVSCGNAADLGRLASFRIPRRYCRINPWGPWTRDEVERALEAGTTDLFLPMVRRPRDVEATARWIGGRCRFGLLVETREALDCLRDLAAQPVDFVYVGLNDLAISLGSTSIFDSLIDGTVDRVRDAFDAIPFGCGGVTAIDKGCPIPARLLLAELARLGCRFSFGRRSFRRDMADRDLTREMPRIQHAWYELLRRSAAEIDADRVRFIAAGRHASVPAIAALARLAPPA
jgi:hypothetical protein